MEWNNRKNENIAERVIGDLEKQCASTIPKLLNDHVQEKYNK